MHRRAAVEAVLVGSLIAGCVSAQQPPPASASNVDGWYAHPDPGTAGVRVSSGETLFLRKYDVEIRHAEEYLGGLCMDREDGGPSPSPMLRTRVEIDEQGGAVLIEETNRPGECSRTPKNAVTRTKLQRIDDPAKVTELDAKVRPFFDAKSCERYDACCADSTRKDWDVHCERRRNFAAGCWSHWLQMNDDRACP